MPAFTTLTINDGAATPLAHAFEPIRKDGAVAHFAEAAGDGSLIQRNLLSYETRLPINGNRKTALSRTEIVAPLILAQATSTTPAVYGLPTIIRVEVLTDPRATEAEVQKWSGLIPNLMNNAAVKEAYKKRTSFS